MAQHFDPIFDAYFRQVNQATWQPKGDDYEINLGTVKTSGFTPNLTDIEIYTTEYAEKTLARQDTIQKDGTMSMTVASLTRTTAGIVFMDTDEDFHTQPAVLSETKVFENLKVGRIYNLGKSNVTIISADDDSATPIEFEEDTHYRLSSETGRMQLRSIPVGAAKLSVNFSAEAVTEADDVAIYGGMSGQGAFGILRYYGISNIGTNFMIEFWNVRLKPTGELSLQGADDYSDVSFEARVFADGSKPVKFKFFKVTELKG